MKCALRSGRVSRARGDCGVSLRTDRRCAFGFYSDGGAAGRRATHYDRSVERSLRLGRTCARRCLARPHHGLLHRLAGELLHRVSQRNRLFYLCRIARAHISPSRELKCKRPRRSGAAANLNRKLRTYIFAPFSLKNFTAPGCHGIGELAITWFSTVKLDASLCTATRSAFFSMISLTMS